MANKFFYSPYQFAGVRFFTGMGLFFYFITRRSYAPEFSSYDGLFIPLSTLSFPNLFTLLPTIGAVRFVLLTLALLSVLLAFGVARRIFASVLSLGFICTISGIPLLPDPFSGFIVGLLLLMIFAPAGEPLSISRHSFPLRWRMSVHLYNLIYALSMVGILVSAYRMLHSGAPQKLVLLPMILLLALALMKVKPIRLSAWLLFIFISFIWASGLANIVFLVAFATFILESNTRFPWQPKIGSESDGIIFVDGECVVCDEFATVVLAEDKWKQFKIATLQGPTAQRMLPAELRDQLSTVVVHLNGEFLTHSSAVLGVLQRLPGLWAFAILDQILVPKIVRDSFYKTFAKYRYRVFGKKEVCSLPSPEERERILD